MQTPGILESLGSEDEVRNLLSFNSAETTRSYSKERLRNQSRVRPNFQHLCDRLYSKGELSWGFFSTLHLRSSLFLKTCPFPVIEKQGLFFLFLFLLLSIWMGEERHLILEKCNFINEKPVLRGLPGFNLGYFPNLNPQPRVQCHMDWTDWAVFQ